MIDLKQKQAPLKERYRADGSTSQVTLTARASEQDEPVSCSVDLGRAIHEAEAHVGVGGPGTAACSGDMLLGALAACAQLTCQMVATAMEIETERIEVNVEGDLDLRGTLGVNREVTAGFGAGVDGGPQGGGLIGGEQRPQASHAVLAGFSDHLPARGGVDVALFDLAGVQRVGQDGGFDFEPGRAEGLGRTQELVFDEGGVGCGQPGGGLG